MAQELNRGRDGDNQPMERGRYPLATALVERVMAAYGIDRSDEGAVRQLAQRTGIDSRYLYRWLLGQTRPNAENTLDLLERAGLLGIEDVSSARLSLRSDDAGARRHDELMGALGAQAESLRMLEIQLRDLVSEFAELKRRSG
jgi:transcriptional regulator with XRE-family HTH domain